MTFNINLRNLRKKRGSQRQKGFALKPTTTKIPFICSAYASQACLPTQTHPRTLGRPRICAHPHIHRYFVTYKHILVCVCLGAPCSEWVLSLQGRAVDSVCVGLRFLMVKQTVTQKILFLRHANSCSHSDLIN